ncbi:MAG: sugar porter family MFS transporter, partial [Prolixibacteraceae bacterium]
MKKKNGVNFKQLLLYSLVAALGGLLFGFDIAIITGAGPFLTIDFGLNSIQEGWAYSSLLFGCILGAAVAGRMTDSWGRKRILIFVAIVFAVTSVWSGLADSLTALVIARLAGGLAVGAASTVSPMYISEVSPAKYRGSLVSMYQLFIVTGILISYLINYLLYDIGPDNWRWMFATGAIPSLLFLIMLFFVSETPRYLYLKGEKEKSLAVLEKIGGKELAKQEIEEIKKSISGSSVSFRMLLHPSLRKVLVVGLVLAVFVQLSGINTIIDYAPKIFATAGWEMDAGLFATFGLGIVNFVSTWVSILIIDRFGRRPLYIIGSAGMTLALLGLSVAGLIGHFSGLTVLFLIVIFLMFFSSCIGPVFWTYMSEIFPNRIRGTALSVPVFTQWVFNALVVLVFPAMLVKLDTAITFGILAVFAFGQFLFALKFMEETKGKSLEE